jgi:hypothetical protein
MTFMRRALPVALLLLTASLLAQPAPPPPPQRPGHPPDRCCMARVFDMKGKLFGEVITIESNHGVAVANARYELKGGDSVVLRVAPWFVMSDTAPGGSNVVFTTPNCSGNDAFVTLTPQLSKRQAVILNVGQYPQFNATEAWLWVSDPFPTPTSGTIATVFHSQWDNGACSPYPAPGFTFSGTIFGGVWVHRVEDLYKKYSRPFWIP